MYVLNVGQDTRGVSLAQWSSKDPCWEQGDIQMQCVRIYQTHHDCLASRSITQISSHDTQKSLFRFFGAEKSNLPISSGLQSILKLFTWVGILERNRVPVTLSFLPLRKVTHSSIWHLSDILRYSSLGKQRHF